MKYLIVDDHPILLNALAAEMRENQCFLATSLQQSLDLIKAHPDIDLILFDLGLPDSTNAQGVLRLRAAAPSTPILVLSGNSDAREIKQTLEFGAAGFVIKSAEASILRQAIALVLAGGTYIPPEIFGLTLLGGNCEASKQSTELELTPREKDILPLVAMGLSNKAIAWHLDVSENTVRVHVAHIMQKMDVDNRTQLASKFLLSSARAQS